jgi:hypothetical protein
MAKVFMVVEVGRRKKVVGWWVGGGMGNEQTNSMARSELLVVVQQWLDPRAVVRFTGG